VAGTVIPPSERAPDAGIDPRTDAVVLKCLAKEPGERFESTDDFGDALRDCVSDRAFLRDAERLPGIREAGFDLTPEEFEPRDFANTRRFHRARAQGTRDLIVGVALVVLVGAGLALWFLRDREPAAAAVHLPAPRAEVSSVASPVVPSVAAPPTIEVPPGSSTGSSPVAHPPSVENSVPVGLGAERKGRRMPVMPPLSQQKPIAIANAGVPDLPKPAPPTIMPALAPAAGSNPAADSEALLHEAQKAWVRKYYAVAVDRARSALALSPDLPLAHQIITLCSCGLHRTEDAKLASAHLDPARRQLVRTLCQKDGVILDAD
jgi:hypothetical protein